MQDIIIISSLEGASHVDWLTNTPAESKIMSVLFVVELQMEN